ncbi:alkaline phosphatase D family protein [Effusibacillus consociatus]|uniref:Alkaline phosphatase D family protein n=1 Tax=Effusibacillus consociatus TaxID=1117041 RepID=A0ABV9Q095_9BACL
MPSNKTKAFTIDDYRTLYRTYRSDPDMQHMHENHAMVSIWDDHEFANHTYSVDMVKFRNASKRLLWKCEVPQGRSTLNVIAR